MSKPLRKCRVCGLEANTTEELELFYKQPDCLYGRRTICKKCLNEQSLKRHRKYPLKNVYSNMIARCYNPNQTGYENYGGRGITVCDEWLNDRQAFIDWAKTHGYDPKLEIDRVDNDGNYSPENCRWATGTQQQLNSRRTTTFLEKGTRICSRCKIEKPFSEFNRNAYPSAHGYSHYCKKCTSKYEKERRKKRGKQETL